MVKTFEVNTERLILRQWRVADREPFAALNADPRVMAFFPALLKRAESDALADRCQAHIAEHGWGLWAVELKFTREFIGFVGLNTPPDLLPFPGCFEIGWRLAANHWGQGLATEAARKTLSVGFESLGLMEIIAFTSIGNLRSRRVMQKLRMCDTGETFDHPNVPPDNALRAHCLYRLTHTQWFGSR